MSRQFRYRVTAIVLGGFLLGGPLLISGTASAEQATGAVQAKTSSRQVTFGGGGMLGISCRSHPDVESMVVPANSKIRVVNRTGHVARLELGGTSKGMLADDTSTTVVFRRGTTAMRVTPSCAFGNDVTPVLVTTTPSASAAAAMPGPIPVPTGADSTRPDEPSDTAGSSGAIVPHAVPDERPSRHAATAGHSPKHRHHSLPTTAVAQAATSAARAASPTQLKAKSKAKATTGTREGAAPTFAGMPPGERKAILPGAPQLDVPSGSSPVATEPVTSVLAAPQMAAAEPVAAMQPLPDSGPIGLLALIAAVSVLGVGIAAIRAIVSERAKRSTVA